MKPDFKTWAENIVSRARSYGTAYEEIEQALESAYDQGYSIGLNKGWAIEQDKEYSPPYERLSDGDDRAYITSNGTGGCPHSHTGHCILCTGAS